LLEEHLIITQLHFNQADHHHPPPMKTPAYDFELDLNL